MKVLLTTLNSKYIHSSLALRYLKGYCQDQFHIELAEYTINQHSDQIVAEIYRQGADLVGFSCYIWNIEKILEIVDLLKKVQPEVKILLGGPEVSFDAVDILKHQNSIDYIISGEGELVFKDLLTALDQKEDLSRVKGLTYRRQGEIIENEAQDIIDDLDIIPSPYQSMEGLKHKIIYYESNRGCPFNCQYCLSSTLSKVRYFSLDRVKADLLKLIQAKVRQVKFVDRTFNCNKQRTLEIFKFLLDNYPEDHDINFHFEITADILDDEVIEFIANVPVGYFQFEIGVQSTNPKTLKAIDRKMNFARLSDVVKRLNQHQNMHLHLDLIAGLPYEDYDSFKKSFNDVYALKPDRLQLGFLKLLKGSVLRNKAEECGYIYTSQPPYEVLATKWINYEQMLKLHMIEEVLETFASSHHFDYSINFIQNNFYNDPFSMYEALAEFWEDRAYYRYSHKLENLYKYLQDFYQEYCGQKLDLFNEVLKFDYLLRRRRVQLPEFLIKYKIEDYKSKFKEFVNDESQIKRYLSNLESLTSRQIERQIQVETFKYDIVTLIDNPTMELEEEMTTILFNYYNQDDLFNKAGYKKIQL